MLQLTTNGGACIAPRPKMFARAVAIASRNLSGHGDSTLTFKRAAHQGASIRGRYLKTDVALVGHQMPCTAPTFFLPSPFMPDGPECLTHLPTQGFTTPLGDADDMILAMPPGMGQAVIGF